MSALSSLLVPGVELFAHLRFRAKAALISTAFLIPVLVLGGYYLNSKLAIVSVTRHELQGVAYAKSVIAAANQMRELRHQIILGSVGQGGDLAAFNVRAGQAVLAIQEAGKSHGQGMDTEASLNNIKQFHASSNAPADNLPQTFQAQTRVNTAILKLLENIADDSELTLDPEIDTYYLQHMSMVVLPQMLESVAQIHALASAGIRSGKERELVAEEIKQEASLLRYLTANAEKDLQKVLGLHPDKQAQLNLAPALQSLQNLRQAIADLTQGDAGKAQKIDAGGQETIQGLQQLQQNCHQQLEYLLEQRIVGVHKELMLVGLSVGVFLLAATYMFFSFYLVVNRGLQKMCDHLHTMADGDLSGKIVPVGVDETADLMSSLHKLQESLVHLVSLMRVSADKLAGSSLQVSVSAQDLAQRTLDTVNSLQSTSQAVVEISATVGSTADHAQQATGLARENATLARQGGNAMHQLIQTMDQIRDSSGKIVDILSLIDGIAFQTNILALNAAVEAARAGEAGRGFAVVASEVRALAQRSGNAAREIKDLINSSVDKVNVGHSAVRKTGDTIEKIVLSAGQISSLLDDISIACREQEKGIKQVETTIQELDISSRDNANMVEDTSHAAKSLQGLAQNLVAEVSNFTLSESKVEFF